MRRVFKYIIWPMVLGFILCANTVLADDIDISRLLKEFETVCVDANGNLEAAGFATESLAKQLINIGDKASGGIVSDLMDVDKDEAYRYLLAELLGYMKAKQAVPTLHEILSEQSDSALLRYRVARSLGLIGDIESIQPLIAVLDDTEPLVRMGAAKALGRLKAQEARQKLLQKLDPDKEEKMVNLRICYALGQIKGNRVTAAMLDLTDHNDPSYKYAAVKALGKIRDPNSTSQLIRLLRKDKTIRRVQIIEALGEIGDSNSIPALIEEVHTGDPLSVGKAAEALVRLNAKQAIPNLKEAIKLKKNKTPYTNKKLQKAINVLSSKKETQHE